MKEGLLIGGTIVVAGIFVGYVAYKIAKKNPQILKDVMAKTSKAAADAKHAFAEGFEGAKTKTKVAAAS
jgi:hypothetical protein